MVILLSSDPWPGDYERCHALGIAKILLKPITRPNLLRAITEAFGQRSAVEPLVLPSPPATTATGLKILVVEDNVDNQLLLQAYLRTTPHHLTLAENGAAALARCQAEYYDLVLMDVQMPVMDGYQATTLIRQWEQTHHQPPTRIIALTANALAEDIQKSLAAGCNGHLSKPIKKATLLAAITEYASSPTLT
jgi:CheY-like chemotaxis protein